MKNYLIVFSLLALGVLSCKKDKTPSVEECMDFEFPTTGVIYDFVMDGKQYMTPCFNPNNPNEFVYYFRDYDAGTTQLKKYNIVTGDGSVILNSGKIYGQPKWGKNGWIAFTSAPNLYAEHIFVIKENGDSLQQFTTNMHNLNPFWGDIDLNLYWTYSPNLGSEWYLLRQNLNQNIPDTVGSPFGISDVLNQKWLHGSNPFIGYHDLNSPPYNQANFIPSATVNIPYAMHGLCWSNTNSIFYYSSHKVGLCKVNTQTNNQSVLISFCDSKRYETISCSSDGKYLIAERVDSSLDQDAGKIIEKRSIYLIDLQTMAETKVNLE